MSPQADRHRSRSQNDGISRVTKPRGIFGDRIEHRLDIRRRAGNDAQDFTRRRLLFQVGIP